MKRIDTSTRAVDLFGPGKDGFKDGDLANGTAPTGFNAAWPNMIQEEIAKVIEDLGIALNPASTSQLLAALKGRLLAVRTITATGIYTPSQGTKWVRVRQIGGGGAGGGAVFTSAGYVSAGSGGGSAGYAEAIYQTGFAGVTVTIGVGGVSVAGAAGGNGGASSFGALLTCPGGNGGQTGFAVTNPNYVREGYPSSSPTGSGIVFRTEGSPGGSALMLPANNLVFPSQGAASLLGGGGSESSALGNPGNAGAGYGAGGAGGTNGVSSPINVLGGNGSPGVCIIEEFA